MYFIKIAITLLVIVLFHDNAHADVITDGLGELEKFLKDVGKILAGIALLILGAKTIWGDAEFMRNIRGVLSGIMLIAASGSIASLIFSYFGG